MAGGRKQAPARVANEGGPAKPEVKGKNFNRAEEEQLCRSVLFVSQDRIVGNQQRAGVFWERIAEHYEDHRPDAPRPQRSLETKWGLIKHDVSVFCGVYSQVLRLNKSGTSPEDTLRRSRDLYLQKSAKKQEFAFEHCWLLLKDHPKWADGWSSPKGSSSMRSPAACASSPSNVGDARHSQADAGRSCAPCAHSDGDGGGSQRAANSRPGGSKAAREESRSASAREGAIYAQADATRTMAAAQMKKAMLLEDQNMLLLMTMPDDKVTTANAREYLRLRRGDELKKLRRKLADEEDRERFEAGRAVDDCGRSSATKRRRQAQRGSDNDECEGSQRGSRGFDRTGEVSGAGRAAHRSQDGSLDGGLQQAPQDDDGDEGFCASLSEGGRDGCYAGRGGGKEAARHRGRAVGDFSAPGEILSAAGKNMTAPGEDFGAPGENSNEVVDCSDTEQAAGMWSRTRCADQNVLGLNSVEVGSFDCSWLDMDRVDPCQPTQCYNMGLETQQGGSVHWSAAHSGRAQHSRIDADEYVEERQQNVDVGLTLQGQLF